MPKYHVHLFRELRLYYPDIEADSPEDAARLAAEKPTEEAAKIEDCDGVNLGSLVDLDGDQDYEHSRLIDFDESTGSPKSPLPVTPH
jgi:hypothetical protein